MEQKEYSESPADTVYKWTVRSLYTAAIGLNVYFLYQQYKDTASGHELMAKYDKVTKSLIKPWRDLKNFRRQADETLVEAWIIVDEAKREQEEDSE